MKLDELLAEEFYFLEPTDCERGAHDWVEYTVKEGEDADGNRGWYATYKCCRECGEHIRRLRDTIAKGESE